MKGLGEMREINQKGEEKCSTGYWTGKRCQCGINMVISVVSIWLFKAWLARLNGHG